MRRLREKSHPATRGWELATEERPPAGATTLGWHWRSPHQGQLKLKTTPPCCVRQSSAGVCSRGKEPQQCGNGTEHRAGWRARGLGEWGNKGLSCWQLDRPR